MPQELPPRAPRSAIANGTALFSSLERNAPVGVRRSRRRFFSQGPSAKHANITEAVFETIRSIGPRENLQHHILVYSNGSELQPEEEILLQNPYPRIFPPNERLENVHSSEGDETLAPKEEERADGSDRKGEEEEGNDDDEANFGETADVAIYKLASCIEFMGIDNNGRFVAYTVRSRWTQNSPGILRIRHQSGSCV